MRKQHILILGLVAFVVLLTVVSRSRRMAKSSSAVDQPSQTEVESKQKHSSIESPPPDSTRLNPQDWWNTPIAFYGKVLDERGMPVPDASIRFTWTDQSAEGSSSSDTSSDQFGFFSLTGIKGKYLAVDVKKSGYYDSKDHINGFHYAGAGQAFAPNPNNPEIFHLTKRGEAEALIYRQQLFGFGIDGSAKCLDLIEGKSTGRSTGDISVRITRTPRNSDRKFDWSAVLQAMDGGIVSSDEEFSFMAPESGYQPSIEIKQSATEPDWKSQITRKFFMKSRGGKLYLRVEAIIIPEYNEGAAIDMKYWINPTGSRNLEYDPAKEIKPTK